MADEEKKRDSFTRLFNPILEAICKTEFTGRELRVVLFIIRSTYGWNKKKFPLSKSYIAEGTGISRRHVGDVVRALVKRNIIIEYGTDKKSRCKVYGLNKKYSQWDDPMCPKNGTAGNGDICAPNSVIDSEESGDDMCPVDGAENRHIKRHIKKEKEKKCSQNRIIFNPKTGCYEEAEDEDGGEE